MREQKQIPLSVILLELSSDSTVAVELLAESEGLISLIRSGASKEKCMEWVNENF